MNRFSAKIMIGLLLVSAAACTKEQPVDNNADAIAPANVTTASAGAVAGGPPPIAANADSSGSIPAALQGRDGP